VHAICVTRRRDATARVHQCSVLADRCTSSGAIFIGAASARIMGVPELPGSPGPLIVILWGLLNAGLNRGSGAPVFGRETPRAP
jgi:hypothetical protein